MYESLKNNCESFCLYIFAFDDLCYSILKKLNLKNTILIQLSEFEDEELRRIKPTRTAGEYCWTCTPSVIKYVIERFDVNLCTYLDADLFFFASPAVLIQEIDESSILITEHRYTPRYDQTKTSGIYCVQFISFRNDSYGLKVLNWWRQACIDWCYARFEDGKFGDQKYLDDWLMRFNGVSVLKHLGGGVAPWNVQQYKVIKLGNKLYGVEKKTGRLFEIVFYHFHNLKLYRNSKIDLCEYKLAQDVIKLLYKPYVRKIYEIEKTLTSQYGYDFNVYGKIEIKRDFKSLLGFFIRYLKGEYNLYNVNNILEDNYRRSKRFIY